MAALYPQQGTPEPAQVRQVNSLLLQFQTSKECWAVLPMLFKSSVRSEFNEKRFPGNWRRTESCFVSDLPSAVLCSPFALRKDRPGLVLTRYNISSAENAIYITNQTLLYLNSGHSWTLKRSRRCALLHSNWSNTASRMASVWCSPGCVLPWQHLVPTIDLSSRLCWISCTCYYLRRSRDIGQLAYTCTRYLNAENKRSKVSVFPSFNCDSSHLLQIIILHYCSIMLEVLMYIPEELDSAVMSEGRR